jgi:hypothetical protein
MSRNEPDVAAVRDLPPGLPEPTDESISRTWYTIGRRQTVRKATRRLRRFIPVTAAGGLSAALVFAVVLSSLAETPVPQDGQPKADTPSTRGAPKLPETASQFLLASAEQLEQVAAPSPDQWVYIKTRARTIFWPYTADSEPAESEAWYKADGTRVARKESSGEIREYSTMTPGEESGEEDPVAAPRAIYRNLEPLASDPGKLLRYIYKNNPEQSDGSRGERAFLYISHILSLGGFAPVPPKIQGALYRALALIPEIQMESNVVDLAKRPGIGISTGSAVGLRWQMILDAKTGRFLGCRSVVTDADQQNAIERHDDKGHLLPKLHLRNGDVVSESAFVAVAVVGEPGRRPK